MEVDRHVKRIQNRKLVICLQYVKQSIATTYVFYCDVKHSDILGGPVMYVVTCLFVRFKVLYIWEVTSIIQLMTAKPLIYDWD